MRLYRSFTIRDEYYLRVINYACKNANNVQQFSHKIGSIADTDSQIIVIKR